MNEGVFTICNKCGHRFKLLYDDYGNPEPMTVEIGYCLSGGIYSVSVKCPECKHEESIK